MDEDYFDFQTVDEQPEDLDFDNLKQCPYCKKPIPQNSLFCLYCGNSLVERPRWIIWVSIIVIIAFLLLILL